MKRWAEIIRAICETLKDEEVNLYILEADEGLNWYGVPVKDFCSDEILEMKDYEFYKTVKGKVNTPTPAGEYIALVNTFNFHADIYPSKSPRFLTCPGTSRPYCITRDSFRIGFFEDKKKAVDFFLKVAKKLREKGYYFNLYYS